MTRPATEAEKMPRCTMPVLDRLRPLWVRAASWRRIDTGRVVKVQQRWPRTPILSRYKDCAERWSGRSGALSAVFVQRTLKTFFTLWTERQ
jgi:hypothetical protein